MFRKLIPKGEFGRNVLTLMTGSTIAQAIPIGISPVLTRLYGPEDFGVLAVFTSLTAIFGSVASMRYELAVMLPEADEDALSVGALGIITSGALATALLTIAFLFNDAISDTLANEKISSDMLAPWLYLLPFSVFLVGLYNVLNYSNNRRKRYKDIATASIHKSVAATSVQVIAGLLRAEAMGLIVGQFLGLIANVTRLMKTTLATPYIETMISWSCIKKTGKRYIAFPLYSVPATLANTCSVNMTNILISTFYSHTTLGFYSMGQRMLGLPSVLIGRAISQVFFQQATVEKNETGLAIKTFDKTVNRLLLLTIPTFLAMFFVVEDLFAFIFSEPWRVAGSYTKILIPLFGIRFVVSAVSNTNFVFEKHKITLAWQIGLLILSLSSFFGATYCAFSFEQFLTLYCIVCSLHYIVLYLVLRGVARGTL